MFEQLDAADSGVRGGVPWALIRGDALESLKRLPNDTADCAVTSPPYYWQRDYNVEGQFGQEDSVDEYVMTMQGVFAEVRRVLKPKGLLFLNLGDTYYSGKGQPVGGDRKQVWRNVSRKKYRAVDRPGLGFPKKSLIGIPWRVALALQSDGWIIRSAVRWHKPKGLAEPSATDRPWNASETIFILAKSRNYYFNRAGLDGEEDIWSIVARPSKKEYRHAAPFPESLVERCLACGCKRNGLVLDPFIGSGTTAKVALDRGSPAIGIDLNPAYLNIAAARIRSTRPPKK
ncbi:site-specific DNA-methyltransferase [Bradyrhizobium barranii]|uniref:DNA-methyltransferase n=1 Tax=Bradyrhizobium barranii TaxID=2992140 RepID=UPI0024AF135D|nr:site-specific DNA-methyltransferase [Bradyrhizobium barranii]WFT94393.1 site-specific DNA-methyltransferase [Bradyrhizobium barranii]